MESGARAARMLRAIRAFPKPRQGPSPPPASRRIQAKTDRCARGRDGREANTLAYECTSDQAAGVTCSAPRAAPCPRPLLVCLLGTCVARLMMMQVGCPFFCFVAERVAASSRRVGHAAHGGDGRFSRREDDAPGRGEAVCAVPLTPGAVFSGTGRGHCHDGV